MLALNRNEKGERRDDYQMAFFVQGQVLIKGIIFFGTPFKGSRSANLGVRLATSLKLPLNKTHIMYLRVENQDVAKFVDAFFRVTEQIDLPLLIFFELKKILFFRKRVSLECPNKLQTQLTCMCHRLLDETPLEANLANRCQRLVVDVPRQALRKGCRKWDQEACAQSFRCI